MPILVSACLLGQPCRYDGGTFDYPEFRNIPDAVPVCPEQLGGLPTPRMPAEIVGGDGMDVLIGQAKVLRSDGVDVTQEFLQGAQEALLLALKNGATQAVLKARSPSCGCHAIYDGTFSGKTIPGQGVTAALLAAQGIKLSDEETYR